MFFSSLISVNKIKKNVVICGACKDVDLELTKTINIIKKISDLFENYKIIIYENNSLDDTKIILNDWSKK